MSGLGKAMVGGAKLVEGKSGRQENDFYRTSVEAVVGLQGAESETLSRFERIWEPCCGDGAIARLLEADGHQVVSTDIAPQGIGTAMDFLKADKLLAPAIVTNPPYRGHLPEMMVRHAFDLGADYIAFLLKATYWHAAGRIGFFRRHRPARIYAMTWRVDFLGLERPVMDTIWVVWERSPTPQKTVYDLLHKPKLNDAQLALFDE